MTARAYSQHEMSQLADKMAWSYREQLGAAETPEAKAFYDLCLRFLPEIIRWQGVWAGPVKAKDLVNVAEQAMGAMIASFLDSCVEPDHRVEALKQFSLHVAAHAVANFQAIERGENVIGTTSVLQG